MQQQAAAALMPDGTAVCGFAADSFVAADGDVSVFAEEKGLFRIVIDSGSAGVIPFHRVVDELDAFRFCHRYLAMGGQRTAAELFFRSVEHHRVVPDDGSAACHVFALVHHHIARIRAAQNHGTHGKENGTTKKRGKLHDSNVHGNPQESSVSDAIR